MLAAVIPAVTGEGLKPLTTNQTPRETSHSAIGTTAIPRGQRALRPESEHDCEIGGEQQGRSDQTHQRNDPGHQAGAVQQRAQQEGVHTGHEARSEQEHPVVHGNQRVTGAQHIGSGPGLSQRDHGQQGDGARSR